MQHLTRKRLTTTASLSNQTKANPIAIQSACKRAICLLSLWGLITPKTATAIIKKLGLSHA